MCTYFKWFLSLLQSSDSNALPKTWENKVKKLVQGQQSVLKKINPDFEEDLQDYYFSDDSAADTY